MRAFIAIEISDEVRAALKGVQDELARSRAKVKWTEPENIHVTMKFLGEIDPTQIDAIRTAMAEAATGGPFDFEVAGVGSFPPHGRPSIIWAGVMDGTRLSEIAARLEDALAVLGFEKEHRKFAPHLTIGRVKAPQGAERLVEAIEKVRNVKFGVCRAARFVLLESRLTPAGPTYTLVAEQALSL